MKRYKLLKDLPTFKAGETFYIDENGNLCAENTQGRFELVAYLERTLKKFPNILEDWFWEIPEECKRWRADRDDTYYMIDSCGDVFRDVDYYIIEDHFRYSIGNYFQTEEEAKLALAKLKAYQTIKDDAKGFVPDWSDVDQKKWCVCYNYYREWSDIVLVDSLKHLGQVYFATKKDAKQSLEKHKAEWRLLFDLEEK